MTKSTITRERAQQIFLGNGPEPSASEERELARMTLVAMDSELDQVAPDAATAIRACLPEFPEAVRDIVEECADIAENSCRAAMLQELKKSAGTEAICRSDENVQVLHTKSPAQSDCCPAQNHVSPEQNGDTPAQSQGWIQVSEQMPPSRHEVLVGRWWGEKPRWCCKWATYIPGHPDAQSSGWLIAGASWTPTHWMPLPAAPQEVKSES